MNGQKTGGARAAWQPKKKQLQEEGTADGSHGCGSDKWQ